jgi:hypothetical protein
VLRVNVTGRELCDFSFPRNRKGAHEVDSFDEAHLRAAPPHSWHSRTPRLRAAGAARVVVEAHLLLSDKRAWVNAFPHTLEPLASLDLDLPKRGDTVYGRRLPPAGLTPHA